MNTKHERRAWDAKIAGVEGSRRRWHPARYQGEESEARHREAVGMVLNVRDLMRAIERDAVGTYDDKEQVVAIIRAIVGKEVPSINYSYQEYATAAAHLKQRIRRLI